MSSSANRPPLSRYRSAANSAEGIACQNEWQAHLDAGRIGKRAPMTFEHRLRLIQQEKAVLGRVVTRELLEF